MNDEGKIDQKRRGALETLLFVSGDPVSVEELALAVGLEKEQACALLESMQNAYEQEERGIQLRFINGKAQLCSNPEYAKCVEDMMQPAKNKGFSQSVIETLSIVAYKQPVTRAEVEGVRGVRCEYSINQLLSMGLIEEVGRKQTVGRPALFGTTDLFLQHFGLSTLEDLPHKQELFALAEPPEEMDV